MLSFTALFVVVALWSGCSARNGTSVGSTTPRGLATSTPLSLSSPLSPAAGLSASSPVPQGNVTCVADQSLVPTLVQNINNFGIDLYKRVAQTDLRENIVISPKSVAWALGFLAEGARGETYDEIHNLVFPDIPAQKDIDAFIGLKERFHGQRPLAKYSGANALFIDEGTSVNEDFKNLTGECLRSEVISTDLRNDTNRARLEINEYVARKTELRIIDPMPIGYVTTTSRAILVNAKYMNAGFYNPFIYGRVDSGRFYTLDNPNPNLPGVDVQMMTLKSQYRFAENADLRVLGIDYLGRELTLYLIMPKNRGDITKIEPSLSSEDIISLIDSARSVDLEAVIPKFDIAYRFDLEDRLRQLGVARVFSTPAELSLLSSDRGVYITEAVAEAYFRVNENGTEPATVARGQISPAFFAPLNALRDTTPPNQVIVDRPFLFLVRHNPSRAILFIGRVTDPTKRGEQGLNRNSPVPRPMQQVPQAPPADQFRSRSRT